MKLVHAVTKKEVKRGDVITSFRDEKYELMEVHLPRSEGKSVKVEVRLKGSDDCIGRLFYAQVFDLVLVD